MSDAPRFLSTLRPSRGERRLAGIVVLASLGFFIAAVPFAKVPLAQIQAFIPIYASALVINDAITAVLLLGQYTFRRSLALLVLAGAYLFTALITAAHALSFPGLFAPSGVIGGGTQSTAWLYMFWHGAFPLAVIAYSLLERRQRPPVALPSAYAIAAAVAGAAVVAGAAAVAATAGHDALPVLLSEGRYTTAYTVTVTSVWCMTAAALVIVWRRKRRTVLDLWLTVVLCAWLFDIALAAMLNNKRFDLGFYAGRAYGLLAASFVLIVLLVESTLLYGRLSKAHGRERAERRRLVEQERELIAANQELDAFSYSVSHDLRAPLRAIDGYSRMIEEDYGNRLDAEGMRLLGVVRASTARMAQLIDDLLAFARVSRTRTRRVTVPLEPMVREIIAEIVPAHPGRAIEFAVGDLGTADADPALTRQVLTNLLSNAVKFSRGRLPAHVAVGRQDPGNGGTAPVYYVSDDGAGFDMAYADKLFGVFQRLHSTTEFPGTGVGLAIVARIVARHGGRVWAEGAPGRGATFRFTLAPDA